MDGRSGHPYVRSRRQDGLQPSFRPRPTSPAPQLSASRSLTMRWRTKQQSKHLVLQERNAHAGTPSHWPPKCPKCGESPPARRLARVFPAAHTQQARDSYPLAACPRLPTSRLLTEPGGPKPGPVPSAQGSCWPCWVVGVGARAQPGYGLYGAR